MSVESIPAIHARLTYLEGQMGNINQSLQRLADDMHQLAIASARREEDAKSLARAFTRIEDIERSVQTVKNSIEAADKKRLQDELNEAHSEEGQQNARRMAIIQEVVRTVLIVGASIVLYHFGVKLL